MALLRTLMFAWLAAWGVTAYGGARAVVCFNYGCASQSEVVFDDARLEAVRATLAQAGNAAAERQALARSIGSLLGYAGTQAPIAADRAGNLLDAGVEGRMDCIDHATTTTRLLVLLEERGWLRFHRMRPPERRSFLILQHFSAVIEEVSPAPAPPAAAAPRAVPDYVAPLLALCDCPDVLDDLAPAEQDFAPPEPEANPGARFALDSWFVDHGEPAVVLPLEDWMNGEGPNVQ